jgi:phospholipase/lecithinase/hemolysin
LIGEAAQTAVGIVQADLSAAQTAFNQGIGTVIFETLPAPSFLPAGQELPPELQAIGDAAVDAVNLGLRVDAAELRLEGHDARIVDLAKITGEISADPAAFGLQDLSQPTLLGKGIELSVTPAAPPLDQTAFFDPLHATTKLHAVLTQFAATSPTSHADFGGGGNHFHHRQPWRQPRLRRRQSGSDALWAEIRLQLVKVASATWPARREQ